MHPQRRHSLEGHPGGGRLVQCQPAEGGPSARWFLPARATGLAPRISVAETRKQLTLKLACALPCSFSSPNPLPVSSQCSSLPARLLPAGPRPRTMTHALPLRPNCPAFPQVGIVSGGAGQCAGPALPGVFLRLDHYMDWWVRTGAPVFQSFTPSVRTG